MEIIKSWIAAEWAEENPIPSRLQIVVNIKQLVFANGDLET